MTAEAPRFAPISARDAWCLYAERPETPLDQSTRREVLPPPGDGAHLRRLVMRILALPLDMRRPQWEMTVITCLRGGKVVIVNRAHHAMVDGVSSVDILTLLLDTSPEGYTPEPQAAGWRPRPRPSNWQLIRPMLWNLGPSAKSERTRVPAIWNTTHLPWTGLLNVGRKIVTPRPDLFFNRKIGPQRTGRGLKVPLSTFKALKERFGCTVNDAVLAVVSEGLHRW